MFTLIIFSIIFIISAVLLILSIKNIIRINIKFPIFLLSLFLLLSGGILTYYQCVEISDELIRHHWPETTGKVTDVKIVGERAYSPQITCQYQVDRKEYKLITDLKTPGFGRKRSRHSTAQIIINEYPVGSSVTIIYNPENPLEAYIRSGPYWNNYMQLSLGIMLFAMGFLGALNYVTGKFVKKNIVN